jgi:hypothetical protein
MNFMSKLFLFHVIEMSRDLDKIAVCLTRDVWNFRGTVLSDLIKGV